MARGRRIPKRSNAFIGLVALILAAVVLFFGFTKDIPFTHGFLVKAQFESANSIRPNSPVRIAGVEVGKVKSVTGVEDSNAALLTMELDDSALPLHEDATAKIRPRIFLEGNFFVDLKPGTPGAPTLDSGDTITVSQTASPVQLDQVLTSLQSDSREDVKALLNGLNTALNSKDASGTSAAESFNRALDDIPQAEKSSRAGARGAARHRARARRRAADPGDGQHGRRARSLRERAQGPDHEPEPDDGGVRERVGEPERVDPRAGADAGVREHGVHLAERGVPADARVRAQHPARRARDAGDDRGGVPVDRADARARRRGRARRPRAGALAGDRGPREADRPRDRAAAADRPRVQVPDARSSCPPATS